MSKIYRGVPTNSEAILKHLRESTWNGLTGKRIASALNLPYDKVMSELIALKRDGKVNSERNGLLVVYSII